MNSLPRQRLSPGGMRAARGLRKRSLKPCSSPQSPVRAAATIRRRGAAIQQFQQALEVAVADVVAAQFLERAVRIVVRGAIDTARARENAPVFVFAQRAGVAGALARERECEGLHG